MGLPKICLSVLTPEEFLSENYEHLYQSGKKISGNHELAQESLHYSIENFLGKENVQGIVDSGGATFYIVAILLRCWRSKTSPFYRQHLAPTSAISDPKENQEEDLTQELYNLAIKKLEGLHWYDQLLFKTYVDEGHTISSLSRATGIPRTSISLTINRVKNYLQTELKKLY